MFMFLQFETTSFSLAAIIILLSSCIFCTVSARKEKKLSLVFVSQKRLQISWYFGITSYYSLLSSSSYEKNIYRKHYATSACSSTGSYVRNGDTSTIYFKCVSNLLQLRHQLHVHRLPVSQRAGNQSPSPLDIQLALISFPSLIRHYLILWVDRVGFHAER